MPRRAVQASTNRPAAAGGSALPALSEIRPRAHDPASGDPLVELRFENGARVRYRASSDGIREEWIGPADESPARAHLVSAPVEHDADGAADAPLDARPSTRVLSDRALCTMSSYLSFDNRQQAAFVWGDENVAVLLGE